MYISVKIVYLCHQCCELLDVKSNEIGVNQVGRKECYLCDDNSDWLLHVAEQSELDLLIGRDDDK
jgi:hypothetical protein